MDVEVQEMLNEGTVYTYRTSTQTLIFYEIAPSSSSQEQNKIDFMYAEQKDKFDKEIIKIEAQASLISTQGILIGQDSSQNQKQSNNDMKHFLSQKFYDRGMMKNWPSLTLILTSQPTEYSYQNLKIQEPTPTKNKKLKQSPQSFINMVLSPNQFSQQKSLLFNQDLEKMLFKEKLQNKMVKEKAQDQQRYYQQLQKLAQQQKQDAITDKCSKDILRFFSSVLLCCIYEVVVDTSQSITCMDKKTRRKIFKKFRNLETIYKGYYSCQKLRRTLQFQKITNQQWEEILNYKRVYDKIDASHKKGGISRLMFYYYVCFIPNLKRIRDEKKQQDSYKQIWGETERSFVRASWVQSTVQSIRQFQKQPSSLNKSCEEKY